jgi:hypothetical protein
MPVTYPLVTEIWVSQASPTVPSRAPAVMRRRGPIRGSDRAANWEEPMMAAVTGRKAKPACRGL